MRICLPATYHKSVDIFDDINGWFCKEEVGKKCQGTIAHLTILI